MGFRVGMAMGGSGLAGINKMRAATSDGASNGLLKAIALVERHHKTKEWRSSVAGNLRDVEPHPTLLTVRTGMLKRSYTRELAKHLMRASYGSGLVYAPVHEYGSPKHGIRQRPTLERTAQATAAEVERILADSVKREIDRG